MSGQLEQLTQALGDRYRIARELGQGGMATVYLGSADIVAVPVSGDWVAYTSNELGLNEVYVRPFPRPEAGRWQVSARSGSSPVWSADGKVTTRDGHFLFLGPTQGTRSAVRLVQVDNWFADLRAKLTQ